jgi:uncharacterized protein (TIRG00374 family)
MMTRATGGSAGRILRFGAGAIVLAFLLTHVAWRDIWTVFERIDTPRLSIVVALCALVRLGTAAKWWYLLNSIGVPTPFIDAVRHFFVGGFIANAVQLQWGGDAYRIVALGRVLHRTAAVAASVIIDRVMGGAALGIAASAACLVLAARIPETGLGLAMGMAALLFALGVGGAALAVAFGGRVLRRLGGWWPRSHLDDVVAALRVARERRRALVICFLLTITEQLATIVIVALLTRSLGLDLPFALIAGVVPIIAFFAQHPISPDAFGMREALSVVLFGLVGVPSTDAVALALLSRGLDLVVLGCGALVGAALVRARGLSGVIRIPTPAEGPRLP